MELESAYKAAVTQDVPTRFLSGSSHVQEGHLAHEVIKLADRHSFLGKPALVNQLVAAGIPKHFAVNWIKKIVPCGDNSSSQHSQAQAGGMSPAGSKTFEAEQLVLQPYTTTPHLSNEIHSASEVTSTSLPSVLTDDICTCEGQNHETCELRPDFSSCPVDLDLVNFPNTYMLKDKKEFCHNTYDSKLRANENNAKMTMNCFRVAQYAKDEGYASSSQEFKTASELNLSKSFERDGQAFGGRETMRTKEKPDAAM